MGRRHTIERYGLGYGSIAADNPGVVYCSITGFGSTGGRDLLGYDFIAQAIGGLMSITGDPDGEPTKVGVALVDVLTGKDAFIGILAALEGRRRTGRGDRIEVNLLSSLLGSRVNVAQASLETGQAGRRMANRHPSIAPCENLRCQDAPIAVACGNDEQFARFTAVIGAPELAARPEFATNAARVDNRDDLVRALEQRLATDRAEHWIERLITARVPAGRVNTVSEAIELAQRLGLDPLTDVGEGWSPQINHPIRWAAYETAPASPPPQVGADSEPLREWLAASRRSRPLNGLEATPGKVAT